MKKQGLILATLLICVLAIGMAGCDDSGTTADISETTASVVATTTTTQPTTTTTVVTTGPPIHWAKHQPSLEPAGREGHDMVYDPNTERVLLFGGRYFASTPGDGYFGDLWAYDSVANTWTELHPAGPSPSIRAGHAMAYDPNTQKVLLFGGAVRGIGFNDLWAYDSLTNTWTELHPSGQELPSGFLDAVYNPTGGEVIFSSTYGSRTDTLWSYDSTTNTFETLDTRGDVPRGGGHDAVYDPATGKIVFFKSLEKVVPYDDGATRVDHHLPGSLYAYDSADNAWEKLNPTGSVVLGRDDPAMVYHPGSGLIVLFGGLSLADSGPYADPPIETFPYTLIAYDSAANAWEKLDQPDRTPFGRTGHAMAYDAKTGKIIMFGGRDAEHGYFSGTWTLSP